MPCDNEGGAGPLAEGDATQPAGWERRRFLQGIGILGAAGVASGLVTSRASFASTPSPSTKTLVVVFLRGAADGLSILCPTTPSLGSDFLGQVRPALSRPTVALPGQGGWALNAALTPLYQSLWNSGEFALVPAVASPGATMSHFQAQSYMDDGGVTSRGGWLDRMLPALGPGTDFRAVSAGTRTPASLLGRFPTLGIPSLSEYKLPVLSRSTPANEAAVRALYRGLNASVSQDVTIALRTVAKARQIAATSGPLNGASYPAGSAGEAFSDLAKMLRAEVGMRIATVDLAGWDTHANQAATLDTNLAALANALNAFMVDLGPQRRSRVTVVAMTEFGRRVTMNASGGTDHGHGSVMLLLGGGLRGSGVFGRWDGLSSATLDSNGNVPGWNDPFDVLGEIAMRRLGAGALRAAFPDHSYRPLSIAA